KLMAKNKIKHLPVLKNDKLVGIITSGDLLQEPEDIDEDFAI
ncbi:CBS domain-containing protein, partial [Candidatus Pacearchaeota archaeon]|nr:CBS domain-containing protein [Candidatus Pacearchaeota archaeon]